MTASRVFSVQAWYYNRDTFKNRKSEVNVVNQLCHLILIICRMALVPSRSDEIEKLKLPGDLDPLTFDLELDPPYVRSHVPRITHAKFHLIPSNGLATYKGQTNIQTNILLRILARPACERPHPPMATDSPTGTDNSVVVLLVYR